MSRFDLDENDYLDADDEIDNDILDIIQSTRNTTDINDCPPDLDFDDNDDNDYENL